MAREEQSFFDKFFGGEMGGPIVPIVVCVLTAFCCCGIGLLFSILGFVLCQEPEAKARAKLCTIITGSIVALVVLLNIVWWPVYIFVLK